MEMATAHELMAVNLMIQNGTGIIPMQAKGGEDKSAPFFRRCIDEYEPEHATHFFQTGPSAGWKYRQYSTAP